MKRKRGKTKNQIAFLKQVQRIKRIQRQLMSQGYALFDQPDLSLPKRVTKQAIERLKEITPRRLRNKAEIVIGDEILTATQVKRKKIKITPEIVTPVLQEEQRSEVILGNFFSELGSFPGNLGNTLKLWGNDLVKKYGKEEIAKAIEKLPAQFTDYYTAYAPDYGKAVEAFESDLINLLPGDEEDIPDYLRNEIESYEEWEEY